MTAADNDAAGRITRLEELVAHQARTIDELSAELASQWAATDQMRKRLEMLIDRFVALEQASVDAPAAGRPPHY